MLRKTCIKCNIMTPSDILKTSLWSYLNTYRNNTQKTMQIGYSNDFIFIFNICVIKYVYQFE